MKRMIKWGIVIIAGLLVMIFAAVIIIPMVVDVQKFKPGIEKRIAEATGRPVTLGGDLHLSIFPWAGVSFSDLHLGNPPDFAEKDSLIVTSCEVRGKLLPLLFKDIQIKRFVIKSPRIILIKNKNGQFNWKGKAATDTSPPLPKSKTPHENVFQGKPAIQSLRADSFSIIDGTVLWIDHSAGKRREISNVNLQLQDVSLDRPIRFSLTAILDKQPLSVKGDLGTLREVLDAKRLPLNLSIKALRQLDIHLKGRLEDLTSGPKFNLSVDVSSFSPRKLLAELDMPFRNATADPQAFNRLALKADINGDTGTIAISAATLDIDKTKLNFALRAKTDPKPDVTFDIRLDDIDLKPYLPPPEKKPPSAKTQKTDFTLPCRAAVKGTLQAGALNFGDFRIENLKLKVNAENGKLSIDPFEAVLFGAAAKGAGLLDFTKPIPFIKLDCRVAGLNPELILKALDMGSPIKGALDVTMNIASSGTEQADLIKNLDGKVFIGGRDLKLIGLDIETILEKYEKTQNFDFFDIGGFVLIGPFGPLLTKAFRNAKTLLAVGKGESTITKLVSDWEVAKGVAAAKDVAFSTRKNRIAVKGSLDIPAERFQNLKIALIDKDGCIKFSQTLNGSFSKPEIDKADFVRDQIVGPVLSLLGKAKKALLRPKCEAFYSGAVPHPTP